MPITGPDRGCLDAEFKRPEEALPTVLVVCVALVDADGRVLIAKRPEEAIPALDRALARNPNYFWAYLTRAAVLGELGSRSEAVAAIERVLSINPRFSLGFFETAAPFRRDEDRQRYVSALREAGLPE